MWATTKTTTKVNFSIFQAYKLCYYLQSYLLCKTYFMNRKKFKEEMEELKKLNEEVCAYMVAILPIAWSKHAFDAQ